MKCKTKLKHNCGIKTNARCVFYDLSLPETSKLKMVEDCLTVEETTEDLYNLVDYILESIDTSGLGEKCLTYKKSKSKYNPLVDVVYIKDVLLKLEDEICKLKEIKDVTLDDVLANLNFKCLTDPCDENITTLTQLLQILIDEICKLKTPVN